jgi:hypothetical protein
MDPDDVKPAALPLLPSVANGGIPLLHPLAMGDALRGISDAF